MEMEWYKLDGQFECERRRSLTCNVKSKSVPVTKQSAIQRDILKEFIRGNLKEDEIPEEAKRRMDDIPYRSLEEKRKITEDIIKRLKRTARSFRIRINDSTNPWAVYTDLPKKTIRIETDSEEIVVTDIEPDIMVQYGSWMCFYKLRSGAARNKDGTSYTQDDASVDKKVYALLKYGSEYLKDIGAGKTNIAAGYLFLKKRTDRSETASRKEYFDHDLFLNDRMELSDNVVTVMETYEPGRTGKTGADLTLKPIFEKYAEGMLASDCTKKQCGECDYADICHYVHAPKRIEEEKRGMTISALHLSKVQRAITEFDEGYAKVDAGPGGGKTMVLSLVPVRLFLNDVKPSEVVILTFTNSGAEVFKERVAKYNEELGTGEDISDMVATTFNGLGQMILEKEYKSFGFSVSPRVIDPIERSGIIAELLNRTTVPDLDYRNFTTDMKNCKGPLAVASRAFELMKTKGYTKYDAGKIASEIGRAFCSDQAASVLADLYDEYNAHLKEKGLVEYADQEMMILDLLRRDPYYFDSYGWKHILVDECQDTSENQLQILKHMTNTASFKSLMVVGDDSQSIYGFRDTSPDFFIHFEEKMGLPKGTVKNFSMVDNFRSTPEIVEFANRLIEKNTERVIKEIVAQNDEGDAVRVKGFLDIADEYGFIVREIAKEIKNGTACEDIAFIASNRNELMKVASLLTEAGIPSVMLNPEHYLENSRVRAALALARFFQDKTDTKDLMIYLNAVLGGDLISLTSAQIDGAIVSMQKKTAEIYDLKEKEFRAKFFELLDEIDEDDEIYESFVDTLKHQPTMADVLAYCDDFELYGEKAERRREHTYPGVVLTTAHSSKGMEWPAVFVSVTKFDDKGTHEKQNVKEIEEKRRLLFVAATRARERLTITGVYSIGGKSGDPIYNQFLLDCFDAADIEIDRANISLEIAQRGKEKRAEKEKRRIERREALRASIVKTA